MTSVKESFQETSEGERQAVISAQQLAISLRREMSQATTACSSWENEVTRLTREVAEQSTKRIAGGNPRITHLLATTRKMLFATLLRRQKKLIHNHEHRDPQKATLWVAYSATALSDTRTVADESTSRGKKQKNSNLSPGSKRRNSIRGKPRNNIGINSSSISQQLVSRN